MSRILRWLIVIPFGLLLAVSAGVIAFFVASVIVPELGILIGTGFQALVVTVFDRAMTGIDPSDGLVRAFALGGRLAAAIFVAPLVLVAVACEIFRLRSGILQITGAGALAALLPLAMLQIGRSPTAAEGRVIAALFFVGTMTGLVYWLVAGRNAGGRGPGTSRITAPASRES